MKLLINEKEIANFLLKKLSYEQVNDIDYLTTETDLVVRWINKEKIKPKFELEKFKIKFKKKIHKSVERDTADWYQRVKLFLENRKNHNKKLILKYMDRILDTIGEEALLNAYRYSHHRDFVKGVGLQIEPDAQLVRRNTFRDYSEICLIRNTVGNEELLAHKIDNNLKFWFIDSGYTNFIESNKKWHRLVKNHIHTFNMFDAPPDRLSCFSRFPAPWRDGGDTILILEPGTFSASIFHVDIEKWKSDLEVELRKYTDKKIIFREKFNKKSRPSLYKFLCNEDVYCTISINSNGATESIWAGVPAITLDKHISNPVTRNQLNQINDLYRGPLGNWLCWLSYSQFTYEELISGKAVSILRQYHV